MTSTGCGTNAGATATPATVNVPTTFEAQEYRQGLGQLGSSLVTRGPVDDYRGNGPAAQNLVVQLRQNDYSDSQVQDDAHAPL